MEAKRTFLVSLRSGAPLSMPGMLDIVLNLGINDKIASALAKRYGEKFAYDTYRMFLQLFGSIVLKVDKLLFDNVIEDRQSLLFKQRCNK